MKETVALILIAGISGGKNKGRELVFEIPPHVHELVDFSSAILTYEVTDVISFLIDRRRGKLDRKGHKAFFAPVLSFVSRVLATHTLSFTLIISPRLITTRH